FSLANKLYRGTLPASFQDLTWVEEKICVIYCATAHVTQLYQLLDPTQPKIFHRNICAHDTNIVSTATVLPHTPTGINGILSVVFVGPGNVFASQMGPMFWACRRNILVFLLWLRYHNHLYTNLSYDFSILDLYPEDDALPGLEDQVVHNK
ncbi:hypothetical protein SERLA73DRAFT_37572, partial [Serpula lacrymans var. lacrymans S7.3]